MKVTLKRADRYARLAMEEAKKFELKASELLSIHGTLLQAKEGSDLPGRNPIPQALNNRFSSLARENEDAVQTTVALIEANFAIRQQIAEAGMAHGISALLTREEEMKNKETILTGMSRKLSDSHSDLDEDLIAAMNKAAHQRNTPSSGRNIYGDSSDKIAVKIPNDKLQDDLEQRLRRIKQERIAINERLTVLNVHNSIDLDETTVNTLRKANIIEA